MFQFETKTFLFAGPFICLLSEFISKNYFGTEVDQTAVKQCFFTRKRPLSMSEKKILVPLVSSAKGLKSVPYALSLAERLSVHVYILQQVAGSASGALSIWMDEALLDAVNSARQAGEEGAR